jgi:hypothetical protein
MALTLKQTAAQLLTTARSIALVLIITLPNAVWIANTGITEELLCGIVDHLPSTAKGATDDTEKNRIFIRVVRG